MRIAIVAPEQIPVPPVLGGSVEITILAVAKKLAEHHAVTVISRTHRRYPKHSVISGVHVHRVPSGGPQTYLDHVRRFLADKSFDVIQIDNRPRFVPAIKAQFPHAIVSLFLHSLTFVSAPYASRAKAARGLEAADLVIANSRSLKRQLIRRFPEAASKIRTVWLGVDTSRFRPASREKAARSVTLLFAGRLIPRKGLPVLLHAIRQANPRSSGKLKLIVAGGAQRKGYMARMKRLARSLRVSARFLGTVPHRRIHRIYRQADIFVCPSQKHEAFGLVNVEAMSSGVPVIASDIGGIREIVHHGRNGFLVRSFRSPRAFASAILRLANSPSLLASMKREARKDCLKRFSWSATASRLRSVYASPHAPDEHGEFMKKHNRRYKQIME